MAQSFEDFMNGTEPTAAPSKASNFEEFMGGAPAPSKAPTKEAKAAAPQPSSPVAIPLPGAAAPAKVDPDSVSSTIGRAVDTLQGDFGGTLEAIGEQVGSDALAKVGADFREKQQKEAEKYGTPSISTYKNVNSIGDAAEFAKDQLVGAVPGLGTIMGAGYGAAKLAPGALKAPAAVAGSLLASLGINIGDVQNKIKEIDPHAKSTLGSVLTGGAISLLDVAGAGAIARPLMRTLGKDVAEQLLIANGVKESVVKEAIKHATVGGVSEGATSGIQSVLGDVGAANATDTKVNVDKVLENAINNAIGGSLAGSSLGAATGAYGAAKGNELVEGDTPAPTPKPFEDGPKDPQGGLGRAWSALSDSSLKALEPLARHSTAAKEFIQAFRPDQTGSEATGRTVYEDARLKAGEWSTKLDEVKEQAGGVDGFNKMLEDYQNNETPSTAAGVKFKDLMGEIHTYAKTEGRLDDIGKINRFLPVSADPEIVTKNYDQFIQDILPHYGNDRAKATEAVDNWLTKSKQQPDQVPNINRGVSIDPATGEMKIGEQWRYDPKDPDTMKFKFSQGQIPPENAHLEKQRTFARVPQAILTKYSQEAAPRVGEAIRGSDSRLYNAVHDYVQGAAHRTAFSKRFGARGERVNALIAKSVRQAQAAGYRPSKAEVKRMFDQVDAFNGMLNPIHDRTIKNAQSNFSTFLTLKTLPLAGLSTFVEFTTPAIRGTITDAAMSALPAWGEIGRSMARSVFKGVPKSEWSRMASEAGISLAEATNVAAQRLGSTALTRAGAKITTKYFLANGLSLLTHVNRVYAAKVGDRIYQGHLRDLSAGVPPNSPRGAKALTMLRSMGVNVRDQAHARALFSPQTLSEIQQARQTRIDAMHRFAAQSVIEPTAADVPLWMSDNRAQLLAQLHRYPSAFTNTILPQLIRRATPGWNGGNLAAGSAIVGSLFIVGLMLSLGYAQDELKMVAKNGTLDYKETRTPGQKFLDVANQTIAPAQVSWISDIFSAPRYGSSGFGTVSPAAGFTEEALKSIYNFADKPEEGKIYQWMFKQTPAQFFRPGREAVKELDLIK